MTLSFQKIPRFTVCFKELDLQLLSYGAKVIKSKSLLTMSVDILKTLSTLQANQMLILFRSKTEH